MAEQTQQQQEALRKAAEENRKAEEARIKNATSEAEKGTAAARKSSQEVLKEQQNMKPDPSQETADLIKAGAYNPLEAEEVEQPDGPAQRAAEGHPDIMSQPQRNLASGSAASDTKKK